MSDAKQMNEKLCPVCKMVGEIECNGCGGVYYCNQKHQEDDWKFHKKNCRLIKLVDDVQVDRKYVAVKKIVVDQIIFRENKPLLACPLFLLNDPVVTCLNCYVQLTKVEETKQCDNCGWYMCLSCDKHGPECELMMKYRKLKLTKNEYMLLWPPSDKDCITRTLHLYTGIINVLRALALRENNPIAYKRLISLKDYPEHWAKCAPIPPLGTLSAVVQFIKEFLNIKYLNSAKIFKILGVTAIHSFVSGSNKHCAVFDKVSSIAHDCRPNCSIDFDNDTILVVAVAPIEKGDPLTLCYTWSGLGTAERRQKLVESKLYYCHCARCKDPTEFGTMYNSIKCNRQDCTGYMLPPTFVVSSGEEIPNYICDKCSISVPSRIVDKRIKLLYQGYSKVDSDSMIELETFINKHANIIHENHFMFYLPNLSMTGAIDLKNASSEVLRENVNRCKKLVHLHETLMPDQYLERGMILYNMYVCKDALFRRERPGRQEFFQSIDEFKEILSEAKRLLRYQKTTVKELVETELEKMQKTEVYIEEMLSSMNLL